jgi:hypothetical protein
VVASSLRALDLQSNQPTSLSEGVENAFVFVFFEAAPFGQFIQADGG